MKAEIITILLHYAGECRQEENILKRCVLSCRYTKEEAQEIISTLEEFKQENETASRLAWKIMKDRFTPSIAIETMAELEYIRRHTEKKVDDLKETIRALQENGETDYVQGAREELERHERVLKTMEGIRPFEIIEEDY